MNTIEDRLREQLPQLADALTQEPVHADPKAVSRSVASGIDLGSAERTRRHRSSRVLAAGVAAAAVLLLVGGLLAFSRSDRRNDSDLAAPSAGPPPGFGVWRPIADAPIEARPYAASAWTGTEALFWAGSSLSRDFAYSDGAAFDPTTNSWRGLTVPGWGHPGLSSVFFDGELYALAKGGATRFNPVQGTWVDLPEADDMHLAAAVATDDAVWGLGPTSVNPGGQPDVAIARYEPATDSWVYSTLLVLEATDETSQIVAGLTSLETQVIWTGDEIVAWNGTRGGLAFDPTSEQWRPITPPIAASGAPIDGVLAVTDAGVALLAEVERTDGQSQWDVALRVGVEWGWRGSRIPIEAPETVSVFAAGDWVVIFSELNGPVTVHVPSGEWAQHDDGPLAGVTAPNAVWTGTQLIVWGGVAKPTNTTAESSIGAIWTPPAD
jgi:hypothetical protein